MLKLEFKPPIKCTFEEAQEIAGYLELFNLMGDVLVQVEDKKWFEEKPEKEQYEFLEECAARAKHYIRHNYEWYQAVDQAIEECKPYDDDDEDEDD